MINMKNITEFNSFKNIKKLNEVVDPRAGGYGGGGDTYFANVKGNFAGADQTLIGSAVIKLFRFVKRKGYQVLLYTWFKPNLYREYMSGLLRYIIRNQMNLPKAKTLYDALYTHNVEKQKLEKEVQIKIKFVSAETVSGSTEKSYAVFKIGSFVKNEKDEVVSDGYYKLIDNDVYIKVVEGKIAETNASLSDDPLEVTDDSSKKEEGVAVEKNIEEYIKKIKEEYAKGNVKPEFATKSVTEVDDLIKFFNSCIVEMDEMLADNDTENEVVVRTKQDKEVYKANIKALEELKVEISKKTTPAPTASKPTTAPATSTTPANVNAGTDLSEFNDFDFISEEVDVTPTGVGGTVKNAARVGQVKVGDPKATKNKRIGDELNQLSQVDIDLNDPEFAKQFDDDAKKRACTDVVLEGASEICKVQLGAERLYMHADEKGSLVPDAMLQNNWLKMVQTVKNQFSRFMFVQEVDPITLVKKLSTDEAKKFGSGAGGGVVGVVNEIKDGMAVSDNPKLNKLFTAAPGKFKGEGDLGIVKFNGYEAVYCISKVTIEGKVYYAYRIVASVLSGMTSDKTTDNFSKYIQRDVKTFPQIFRPKQSQDGFDHVATFIIGKTDHLSVSGSRDNKVNILYIFSKGSAIKTLESKEDFSKCLFYCATETQNNKMDFAKVTSGDNVKIDGSMISMGVTAPWEIKSSSISNFGLTQDDRSFQLTYLSDNKVILIKLKKS